MSSHWDKLTKSTLSRKKLIGEDMFDTKVIKFTKKHAPVRQDFAC